MRLPIIEIPENIHKICENYKDNFNIPQFKNFENFVTGIIINDKADIQALSQGFELGKHYDSLHHFLSESHWDKDLVNFIESLNKDRISQAKTNRQIVYQGRTIKAFNQPFRSIISWVIQQTKNSMPEQEIFNYLGV